MVYQEVTYTLTKNDYKRFIDRTINRAMSPGLWNGIGAIVSVALALGVSIYLVWQVGSPIMKIVSTSVLIVVALLILPLFPIILGRGCRTKLREFPARTVTLRLTEVGIEMVDKGSSVTRWSSITGISEDKWGVYFEPVSILSFVPRSAFSQPSLATEFVETARKLHRDNAGRPTEVYRSEKPTITVSYTLDMDDLMEKMQSSDTGKKAASKINRYARMSKVVDIALTVFLSGVFAWNCWNDSFSYRAFHSVLAFTGSAITGLFLAYAVYRSFTGSSQKRFQPQSLLRGMSANLPQQCIRIDDRGVMLSVRAVESMSPWTKFASIDNGPRLIRFQPTEGPAVINIPRSAFTTEDDLTYFLDVARAYIDSARTGNPPTFPEPISWPPSPAV